MLFNKYDKILYTLGTREVELRDIFTKVSFLDDYTSQRAYDEYFVQEGETPEDIAYKVYGNESYGWLVLMSNNIFTEDEWYSGDQKFTTLTNQKLTGDSFYITNLPPIRQGDVMVKVTSTTGNDVTEVDETVYRIISDFNKDFRSVWGYSGSGNFSVDDKIMFARRNTNNGTVEAIPFKSSDDPDQLTDTNFTTIKYIETKKNSPIYLKLVNSDLVIPPNVVYSGGSIQQDFVPLDVVYTNPASSIENNFARTLLYAYMTNSGSIPGITKYTNYNLELDKYQSRKKIRILKQEYFSSTISLIDQLLKSKEIGKRITIGF